MIPNTTSTNLKYRAHIYGNDISAEFHICSENDIMKMIIEMMMGYTNDLYSHSNHLVAMNESSTNRSSSSSSSEIRLDDIINEHNNNSCNNDHYYHHNHHHHHHHKRRNDQVIINVFQLTFYALHVRINRNISSSLLRSILSWFGKLGSYIFICRKYVQHDCHHYNHHSNHHRQINKNHHHNQQQQEHMKEITYNTIKSMINELLVTIDETLCAYESELNTSSNTNHHHHHDHHQYHDSTVNSKHLTILRLYQHCQSWLSLFESTSSIVITAYRSYFNKSNISNDEDNLRASLLSSSSSFSSGSGSGSSSSNIYDGYRGNYDTNSTTTTTTTTTATGVSNINRSSATAATRDRVNCMYDDLTIKGILQDLTSIAQIGDMCEMIYTPTTSTSSTTTTSTTTSTNTTNTTTTTTATFSATTTANVTNSIVDHDKLLISKKINGAIKGLNDCKNGLLPLLGAKATKPTLTIPSSLLSSSSSSSSSSDFESNLQMTNINTSTQQLSKNSLFHRFSKLLLCNLLSSILKDLLTMIMKDTGTTTILIDDCSRSTSSNSYDAVDTVLKSICTSGQYDDNDRRELRSFLIDISKLYCL